MKQYRGACMGFGALMGIVFPPFAFIFVERPAGFSLWLFVGACIVAGLVVGQTAYFLGKRLLLGFLEKPVADIQSLFAEGEACTEAVSTDPLVRMRVDLESAGSFIVDSAMLARRMESLFTDFSDVFDPTMAAIVQGARDNHGLAERTETEMTRFREQIGRLVEIFRLQDEITDKVQTGIAAVRNVLSALAREIRDASNENEKNTNEVLAESNRFLGAITTLGDAASLIGDISRDIRELSVRVAGTADDIREIGDISERTQVLAINANIEAARAGDETGRGFRVIAGTVSGLADRSRSVSGSILDSLSVLEEKSLFLADTAGEREAMLTSYKGQAGGAQEAREKIARDMSRSRELDDRVLEALKVQEDRMRELLTVAEEMNRNESSLMAGIDGLLNGISDLSLRGREMMKITDDQVESARTVGDIYDGLNRLKTETSQLAGRFRVSG